MFMPSNMLRNYLSAEPRDVFDIVGALMGYINADPTFKTNDFELAVQYVLDQGVNRKELFVPFDTNIDFEEDSSKWNEEYYSFARVYLKDNFCEKRIEHVKAVARKLYPETKTSKPVSSRPVAEPVASSTITQTGGSQIPGKKSQSQQRKVGRQSSMPPKTIIVIAIIVIVLLALIIGMVLSNKGNKDQPQISMQENQIEQMLL